MVAEQNNWIFNSGQGAATISRARHQVSNYNHA